MPRMQLIGNMTISVALLTGAATTCHAAPEMASMPGMVMAPAERTPAPATHASQSAEVEKIGDAHDLGVRDAWVRWLPGPLPAAAYMTLTNTGKTPLTIVGASSPDYGGVMLHRTVDDHGAQAMVSVDALALPPGKAVRIAPGAPGGYHWMLTGPRHPIQVGMQVVMILRLSDGRKIAMTLPVSPPTRTQ